MLSWHVQLFREWEEEQRAVMTAAVVNVMPNARHLYVVRHFGKIG